MTSDSTPQPAQPAPPPRRKRRARRVLLTLGGLLGILMILLACLPALISAGVGRGALLALAGRQMGQPITVQSLQLGWLSAQDIRGLEVGTLESELYARVDLRVDIGLWGLLTGRYSELPASVGGSVNAVLGSAAPPGASPAPLMMPPVAVDIDIDDLDLTLHQPGRDDPLKIENIAGSVRYRPGGDLTVQAKAQVASDQAAGHVAIDGLVSNGFHESGAFRPAGASARLEVSAPSVSLHDLGSGAEVRGLTLSASSADLTRDLQVTLRGESRVQGESSPIDGHLTVREPFSADGAAHLDLGKISGRVAGRRLPSAVFEPLLAMTPVVLTRDAGPYLDVEAELSAGAARDVRLELAGSSARLHVLASVDPGAQMIDGRELTLQATVHPQLLAAVGAPGMTEPFPVLVELKRFRMPSAMTGEALRKVEAEGRVAVAGPLRLRPADPGEPLDVRKVDMNFTVDGARGETNLRGTAQIAGAAAAVDLRLAEMLDQAGRLQVRELWPVGSLTVRGINAALLAARLPEAYGPLVHEVLPAALDAEFEFSQSPEGDAAAVQVTGAADITVSVVRRDGRIRVQQARARVTCTPELVSALQESYKLPAELLDETELEVALNGPLDLDEKRLLAGDIGELILPVQYKLGDARLRLADAALAGLAVRGLAGTATLTTGASSSVQTSGRAEIRTPDARSSVGPLEYEVKLATAPGAAPTVEARMRLPQLDLRAAEELVEAVAAARPWTGDRASVDLTFENRKDGWSAVVRAASERIRESWVLRVDPQITTLEAENPAVTLDVRLLAKLGLVPARDSRQDQSSDVVAEPQIRRLRWPTALLLGEPFDPAAVEIDASLTLPAMVIRDERKTEPAVLDDILFTLKADDLSAGVKLLGKAKVRGADDKQAGADLDFTVEKLVSAQGLLDPEGAQLTGLAKLVDLPTVIVDGMLGLEGLLVAAIGPQAIATLQVIELSKDAGTVTAKFRSVNGSLNIPEMRARDGRLVLSDDYPAKAQLRVTQNFRQRLLRSLHPLLADIETSADPLRATVHKAAVPLDGDLSRLDADLDLVIGQVQFRPSAMVLAVMDASGAGSRETLPGRIDDVKVHIRGGVVQYERFIVSIEELQLAYTGSIDLRTGRLDLRHEVPLAVLARHIPELSGYVDNLAVPLVTGGTIDNPQTGIDPRFDLASGVLENTVNKVLDDLLGIEDEETKDDQRKDDAAPQGEQKDTKKRSRRPRGE